MPEYHKSDAGEQIGSRQLGAGGQTSRWMLARLTIALGAPLGLIWFGFQYMVAGLMDLGMVRTEAIFSVLGAVVLAWPLLSLMIWIATAPQGLGISHFTARRKSVLPLHGWLGLIFGGLAYVVMFTGVLLVYDQEIDLWMQPETHLAPSQHPSFDRMQASLARHMPHAERWTITLPNERRPFVNATLFGADGSVSKKRLNPETGQILPQPGSLAATGFFLQLHSRLMTRAWNLGYWLTSVAGIGLFLFTLSGLLLYPRLIADAFTFRLEKSAVVSLTFLHRLSGMFGAPFLGLVTLSGLMMTLPIILHEPIENSAGTDVSFEEELAGRCTASQFGRGALSLDQVVASAQQMWPDLAIGRLEVQNPGSYTSSVIVTSAHDQIALRRESLCLNGSDGALISGHRSGGRMQDAEEWLVGFHLVPGNRPLLRALHAFGGLLGCGLVVCGMLLWAKRRERDQSTRANLIHRATIAFSVGLSAAVLAMLTANKLLPFQMEGRASYEIAAFWIGWVVTAMIAFVTRAQSTVWLLMANAVCAALLALCHMFGQISNPTLASAQALYPGFAFDVVLLAFAAISFALALWARQAQSRERANA